MQLRSILTAALAAFFALTLTMVASAQDGNYMVRYANNLTGAAPTDTIVNIMNTGADYGQYHPLKSGVSGQNASGNVCANIYIFDATDEQLVECCSCKLTPNQVGSYSSIGDFISNPLTGVKPNSIAIKIVGTWQITGGSCNPTTAGQTFQSYTPGDTPSGGKITTTQDSVVVGGLAAWARNSLGGETAFQVATLTTSELARATAYCAFNTVNGSGTGVCKTACKLGAQ